MTYYADTYPVARVAHHCQVCARMITKGEDYWRQAALDNGRAWTNITCAHCEACVTAYCRDLYESEWERDDMAEWLCDLFPVEWSGLLAGWRYPDGGLMPPPFEQRCCQCGCRIKRRRLWCGPCDDARIERIDRQLG